MSALIPVERGSVTLHGQRGLKNLVERNLRVLAAAVGLLAVTNVAWGADMALPAAPPLAQAPYNWTGLYLGVNAGYMSAAVNETVSGGLGTGSGTVSSGIGGAQIGYNYQIGPVVLGFEADFDGTMGTASISGANLPGTTAQIPWIGTFRGRVGVAFDRVLVYATAGGAATQLISTVNVATAPTVTVTAQSTDSHGAWTAGGGIEYGINNYLSAKVEYLYLNTGDFNVASVVNAAAPPAMFTVDGRMQASLIRVGLNLRLPVE